MSFVLGLLACAFSAILFGCMFVPVRNKNTGDGIYAQWIMTIAILLVGVAVNVWRSFPTFYPLAMFGGMLWVIGNSTAIPIISRLGMAMGILIWNTQCCLAGWVGGRYGLFGLVTPHPPADSLANYLGVVIVVIGGALFTRLESNPNIEMDIDTEKAPQKKQSTISQLSRGTPPEVSTSQRILALFLCIVAGTCYGTNFLPVIYIQDKYEGVSQEGLDYVFSHYVGIFITSTIILIIRQIIRRNEPALDYKGLFIPSIQYGLIWASAQTSFFIANENLSQTITFPIITQVPGLVAAVWSVFYFKEIKGARNYFILLAGFLILLCGSTLVATSKEMHIIS